MSNAKIELSLGSLTFSGEGEGDWLAAQLDKVLEAAPELSNLYGSSPRASGNSDTNGANGNVSAANVPNGNPGNFAETLASYLRAKGGETNQIQRFLATADWLRRRGIQSLTTAAVSKALSENQQKKLTNPSECLNRNVSKGYCEKSGDGFYITPDGLKALGYQQ